LFFDEVATWDLLSYVARNFVVPNLII